LWQGDSQSFVINSEVGSVAERYELTVHYLKAGASPERGAVREMAVELPPGTPPGLKLVAYARKQERGLSDTRSFEKVGAAIENVGQLPIRALSLELAALDKEGFRLLPHYISTSTLAWEEDAPMLPGDRRVVRLDCDVTGRMQTDRVVVSQVSWSFSPYGPVATAAMSEPRRISTSGSGGTTTAGSQREGAP
jgi:hypothetical protein